MAKKFTGGAGGGLGRLQKSKGYADGGSTGKRSDIMGQFRDWMGGQKAAPPENDMRPKPIPNVIIPDGRLGEEFIPDGGELIRPEGRLGEEFQNYLKKPSK